MIGGIYIILNNVNDKIYIGSTHNFKERWSKHRRLLNNGKHHSKHLQNAWSTYGENSFEFIEFEYVSSDLLLVREQVWLDFFKPFKSQGYNVCPTAGNSKGFIHSEDTKLRIKNSVAKTGYTHSEETRKRMSLIMIDKKSKSKINPDMILRLKRDTPDISNKAIGRLLNISCTSVARIIKRYTA